MQSQYFLYICALVNNNQNKVKKGLKLFGILGMATVLFYGCNKPATTSSESNSTGTTASTGDLKVAFVYTDSVINKYDYFVKKSEEITEKGKKFEGELQSRAQGFEREVSNFQQSANTMTQNQALAKPPFPIPPLMFWPPKPSCPPARQCFKPNSLLPFMCSKAVTSA